MAKSDYIIRGGVEGRERLRILSRVMRPSTLALLERVGIRPGMSCLEVGCGGGDLACDMARLAGPEGRVVATDIDATKIGIAREEAQAQHLSNIEFRLADITEAAPEQEFDLVHARFVLTHLLDPAAALQSMRGAMRPGAVMVVQDIDFRGHFSYPEHPAFLRYIELYTETVRRRGADANIGPRLPALLAAAGLTRIGMNVVQPAGLEGEVKLMAALTVENIGEAVVAEGLATPDEVRRLAEELYAFARRPDTVISLPRIVEAWGYLSG